MHCICPVAYSEELRICRESHSVNKKMHFLDFVEVLRAALQGSINKLVSKTVEDINVFVASKYHFPNPETAEFSRRKYSFSVCIYFIGSSVYRQIRMRWCGPFS